MPSSKPKQMATVATQTYPASVHFDVSQSPLLSSSVSTSPPPSPSPPLVISTRNKLVFEIDVIYLNCSTINFQPLLIFMNLLQPLNKQYVTYQPSPRFTKVPTPNIKVVRSVSGLKNDEGNGTTSKLIPISSNKGSSSTAATKPTIIYVTIPKRTTPKT